MKNKIKELIDQYNKGGFSYSELEWEILNLYNINKRNELVSAFSWASSIGEQFFDPNKTISNVVDIYEKTKYDILDEVKICPYTGKKYDAVRKVKCKCDCHDPNVQMIHMYPCCDHDGYVEEYRYIE